jgi:hypothetical protein
MSFLTKVIVPHFFLERSRKGMCNGDGEILLYDYPVRHLELFEMTKETRNFGGIFCRMGLLKYAERRRLSEVLKRIEGNGAETLEELLK